MIFLHFVQGAAFSSQGFQRVEYFNQTGVELPQLIGKALLEEMLKLELITILTMRKITFM